MNSPDPRPVLHPADPSTLRRPSDLLTVRVFLMALVGLLAGYMFLGRGFAHVGMRPIFVGEVMLVLGLIATAYAIVRLRSWPAPSRIVWLLIAFMLLGVARTVPYLGTYGVDALRDAVLWGYAFFALMIYVLADRALILTAMRTYGWVVPIFALWLPISWNIFVIEYQSIDVDKLGSFTPLVFFKSGDMAIHAVGSIAFLVLGTSVAATVRGFAGRTIVALSFAWALFLTGTSSRGAFLAWAAGLGVTALIAGRSRTWLPVLLATAVLVVGLLSPAILGDLVQPAPLPTASPVASPITSPGASPSRPVSPPPTPQATDVRSRDFGQLFENVGSIFGPSSSGELDGTRAFRLAWWSSIVDYTIFGPYFWTGKGFGVNLADDDGYQPNADRSLRAPHNTHMTALARMGVPGFVLWITLQGVFGVSLLRSILAHRRNRDPRVAAVGALILVYWTATMVVTSFDPYLEGPQGGIWFWTLFGLGLVVMRLSPPPTKT